MAEIRCIVCGKEVERTVKARGRLGVLHDGLEKVGIPAICCECNPLSNWKPKKSVVRGSGD